MTRWGTSYFISLSAAYKYYKPYGYTPEDVRQKIKDGSIHVGEPPVKSGEKLFVIPDEGRYEIQAKG